MSGGGEFGYVFKYVYLCNVEALFNSAKYS